MGFKKWFKDGMKDAFKEQVELDIIAGSEQLSRTPFKKTQMYKEGDGMVKIFVPGAENFIGKIVDIEWEEKSTRSGGKAAVGAIAGAVVAGPLGGIAGAAVGGRKKDISTALLYLEDDNENEVVLHLECSKADYTKISGMKR